MRPKIFGEVWEHFTPEERKGLLTLWGFKQVAAHLPKCKPSLMVLAFTSVEALLSYEPNEKPDHCSRCRAISKLEELYYNRRSK